MLKSVLRRAAAAAAVALALVGCNAIDLPAPPAQAPVYRLAAGDRVSVQVFGQPDLSGQLDVNADGALSIPLVGAVPAGGRTVADVSDDLRTRLDRSFVVNPRLTIDVVTYRQIFVLGQVNHPGGFPYALGLTVQQAIALAGGFTRRAITDKVGVTRLFEDGPKDYAVMPRDLVLPGDTLDIQRRV